ncbi:MAG: glycoside hydrolase family 130 protein [Phycisphaerales bacterium]|nr:glycoside hydrolase family 130 protein [Phycisphaerales bacterium]
MSRPMSQSMVTRTPLKLTANPKRVLARLFLPGDPARVKKTIDRVLSMNASMIEARLDRIMTNFASRHRQVEDIFLTHFREVAGEVDEETALSDQQQLLIGAYFTMEYSLESVALFNPSMVPHPDQNGLRPGETRFVISLRACGEGHISSIVFRSGVIQADGEITLDSASQYAITEKPVADKLYEKHPFFLKLIEMGAYDVSAQSILARLADSFTIKQLKGAIHTLQAVNGEDPHFDETAEKMLWLAHSNYSLHFPNDVDLSERVIFPVTENESRGIEDARFVYFSDDDGRHTYLATYTAYNGFTILPQIIETEDFRHFKIITLNGKCVQNKGMALFPRKIDGEYHMLSRLDGEDLYLMNSRNPHFWNQARRLTWKRQPWEFIQVGNCGSPLETDEGWLLLTHGVGAMRRYCIGATLLDLEDPSRVIGTLEEPLIMPTEEERNGYVPNVVYSCGGMIHHDELIIPYAMSDTWSGIATAPLPELLASLRK